MLLKFTVMMPPLMLRMKNKVLILVIITVIICLNVNISQVTKTKFLEYYNDLTSINYEKQRQEANTTEKLERMWRENQNSLLENVQNTVIPEEIPSIRDSPPPTAAAITVANVKSLGRGNDVIFPDITNCSMKEYKRKLVKEENFRRRNLYVCRKWREPDPSDDLWPMVVPATNGSILKTLPIHHQDPEVSSEPG